MGATSLATHLAGALARQGRRVCLVDLDFELGDVLSFLDMKGTYTLADVAGNTHRLDRELLDASVPRHASGVWVLSQCDAVADGERLDPGAVAGVLRFLRRHYDHVVVDGLRDFGDLSFAALDVATRIALVVTQEVPAVRSAQRCAAYFGQLGYDSSRLLLLVNRYQKGSPITREVVEETVGLPVAATVANDFTGLSRAVNRGVLLWDEAPRSAVARDMEALAASIAPVRAAAAPASLFRKLFAPKAVIHGLD
jgi:pilus assembly protein CpaE